MRASQERRRIAATIAVRTRDGADAAELARLHRELDQLKARELYAAALSMMDRLPSHADVTEAAARTGRTLRSMGRGEAA